MTDYASTVIIHLFYYSYLIASFFTKANVAAAVGVMVYLISYLPYAIYVQFRHQYTETAFHVAVSTHGLIKYNNTLTIINV